MHARHIEDGTAAAELHALIGSWTPRRNQRAARNTQLRVLAELAELKRATLAPAMPRHTLGGITIKLWAPPRSS